MNIQNFNNGDLIVRTKPGIRQQDRYNDNLGISTRVTQYEDSSYIGEPFKLLDVCNGIIYVELIDKSIHERAKIKMVLDVFEEGWEYFVVPNGYTMEEFQNTTIL